MSAHTDRSSQSVSIVLIKNLHPHPLSKKLYGQEEPDPALVESIKKLGVLEPIIVDEDWRVLSGNRRVNAAKAAGLTNIEKLIFHRTELEGEQLVIEANRQREKTPEQKAREFKELKRIETALAKERQKQGKANLPDPATKGQAREKAAKAVGMSGHTAEKLAKVVDAADAGNREARAALDDVNAGSKSVDAAHKVVAPPKSEKPSAQEPRIPVLNRKNSDGSTSVIQPAEYTAGDALVDAKQFLASLISHLGPEDTATFHRSLIQHLEDLLNKVPVGSAA